DALMSAISQTLPVSLILDGKNWVVLNETQLQSVLQSGTPHYAAVYKQDARYIYVREVSLDKYGRQHALGESYANAGTLERARQALSIPALSSATAERAYYAADGTMIQKTPGFNEKDPTIAMNIKDLRYFAELPPP